MKKLRRSHILIAQSKSKAFPTSDEVAYYFKKIILQIGAFSYSDSHIDRVYNYILNQKAHHRKKTFEKEFMAFLETYGIEVGKKELFDFFYKDV